MEQTRKRIFSKLMAFHRMKSWSFYLFVLSHRRTVLGTVVYLVLLIVVPNIISHVIVKIRQRFFVNSRSACRGKPTAEYFSADVLSDVSKASKARLTPSSLQSSHENGGSVRKNDPFFDWCFNLEWTSSIRFDSIRLNSTKRSVFGLVLGKWREHYFSRPTNSNDDDD